MAVKNYPKEFSVFTGFDVNEFATMGYLARINTIKDRFVGKKRAFCVRLRGGDRPERMLMSLVGAEELPADFGGAAKKLKTEPAARMCKKEAGA